MNDAKELAKAFNELVDVVKATREKCGSRDELTRSQVEFIKQIRNTLCKR